jgi:high-affinity K+ transport system ATPase subunit B
LEVDADTEPSGTDAATLRERDRETAINARVSPAHRLQIIGALQSHGEGVAVTGDGANAGPDSPPPRVCLSETPVSRRARLR